MSRATVHVPPAEIVPPENEIEPALAAGEKAGAPQPVVRGLGAGATFMAPGAMGKVSAKATPLMASFWLGLVMVKVNLDVPPARMGVGWNSLAMAGGKSAVSGGVATFVV